MTDFSNSWNSSKDPGKQRKFRTNAPLHIKGKFLGAHLSDELAKKYGKRAARVRKGDKVKIMIGQFKGKLGKVEKVDSKKGKVYVEGAEIQKKDGTKTKYPITASNVMIIELSLDDKNRQEILKRK
jgi:large subunit ribosomal protein L24